MDDKMMMLDAVTLAENEAILKANWWRMVSTEI
jgi:hypothetical protein